MRLTIPNFRPHLSVPPEPIRVPLSSRCARLCLHVASAASTAHAIMSPRVPRVRSCAAPKPHGRPTPGRDTYPSSPEHRRPLSWLPHICPRRVTCASPHPVPHHSRAPEQLATSRAATLALPHVHACPHHACSPRAGSPPRCVFAQRAARLALTYADATSLSSFSSNAIHLHHVTKVLLTFYSTGKCSISIGQLIA
jgi:hypothetical protein